MRRATFAIIMAICLAATLVGGYTTFTQTDTMYRYDVKSEQVETDAGYNGSAVPIEELEPEHREAVFDAYKKSDHFLGGSSATIHSEEPLDLTQEQRWQVVSIEGVHVLVGIGGPETYARETVTSILGMLVMTAGFVGGMLLAVLRYES